jgi:hypothetical protein
LSSILKEGFDKVSGKDPDLIQYLSKYGDKPTQL